MPQNLGEQERVNVEVACPMNRTAMTTTEATALMQTALLKCQELITVEGKILGTIGKPRMEDNPFTDQPNLIFTFACNVPRHVQAAKI